MSHLAVEKKRDAENEEIQCSSGDFAWGRLRTTQLMTGVFSSEVSHRDASDVSRLKYPAW